MATYVRQSSFSDGDTITAALFNNEFNQLVNVFDVASGHTHDGSTAGDGGPISNLFSNALVFGTNTNNDIAITFNATSNDGVLTWMEDEDYFKFSDDILLTTTEKVQFRDTAIYINSSTDGQLDIVADTEIQIAATTIDINGNADISGNLGVGGNLTVTGTTTFNGGTITMGDAATDNIVFGADVDSNIIPDDDDTYDLGSSTQQWRNLFIDGTANIDSLVADTADINGGTIDAANITVGSGKTLNVSAGTLTLADNQISGNKVEGGTINATTINTLTYGSITDGTITVTAFVDEDNMASNSATLIPTQQSVKAYVDAQDTAQDLDLVSDSGTIAIDLDGETLTVTGGEGIDTSATSNTLTITGEDATTSNKGIASFNSDDFNVSSGAVTLATTSTAAELNLLDGTTAGTIVASKGVAVDANKDITGFRNITLTGELDAATGDFSGAVDIADALDVHGALGINNTATVATNKKIQFRDAAIHISSSADGQLDIVADTEIQIAATTIDINGAVALNGAVTGATNITISGELDAATLDISGNADIDGTLEADAITIAGVTLAETISDTVGAMVASNTETGIVVTYDDADNTLDFVIGDNAIVQSMIADNAIDSQMYVDGSIDTAHIADSQITSAKIADGTIATGDIADDAVTGAKLANNIDVAGTLDVTGVLTADSNVVIAGNLTVQGDTTTLNTATLDVEDKNITLNKGAGDTSGSANGAGLTIQDAIDASNDATILWDTTNDEFDFSHPINVAGKVTSTGTSVFASLDISGDIDVDGTTNLDVVDIDGAVDMASTLNVSGAITGTLGTAAQTNITSLGTLASLSVTGDLLVGDKIRHAGDTDNYIAFPAADEFRIVTGNAGRIYAYNSQVVINEDSTDTDFRVESNNNANILFVDGGNDRITIGGNDGTGSLHVKNKDNSGSDVHVVVQNTTNNRIAGYKIQDESGNTGINLLYDNGGNNAVLESPIGSLKLDVVGDIKLDSDSSQIYLADGGTDIGLFSTNGQDLTIRNLITNKDINFQLSNGGTNFTAFSLDANLAGKATFNSTIAATGATFTTADNTDTLSLISTDADGNAGPNLRFYRNSGSPANNDLLTKIDFEGRNNNSQDVIYASIENYILDVADGSEDGELTFYTMTAGSSTNRMDFTNTQTVFNESSIDVDFRVESDTNTHALFVQGSDGNIGIGGGTSLDNKLEVVGGSVRVRGTTTPSVKFNNNDLETVAIKLNAGSTGTLGLRDNKVLIGSNGSFVVTPSTGGHTVFNDDSVDADFRVESNNNTHALFVDGANGNVMVGGSDSGNAGTINLAVGTVGSTTGGLQLWSPTNGNHYVQFGDSNSSNGPYRGAIGYRHSDDAMVIFTSGAEKFRIASAGAATFTSTVTSTGLIANVPSGNGLLINSADIGTIKMKSTGGGVKNWGFATTNLAASDFGIYQSNANGGDPITAGAAKLYFNGAGNTATFAGNLIAPAATINGQLNVTGSDSNQIFSPQVSTQFDTSSFMRFHPTSTIDNGGFTNIFFGTSTLNNYGVAIGGKRAGGDGTPTFAIRTHNDSISGTEVLSINNAGAATFASSVSTPTLSSPDGTGIITLANTGIASFGRGIVVNDAGTSTDFRVESDNNANALFIDGGTGIAKLSLGLTVARDTHLGAAIVTINSNNSQGLALGYGTGTNEFRRLYHHASGLYFQSSTNQAYLNSAGVWTDASDITYKKDIEDIAYGIETVKKLKPRKYKMKSDDTEQIGFIAQELVEQVPEIVSGKDELLGVAYGQLTAVLTKAIQEQQTLIESLTARITALENA